MNHQTMNECLKHYIRMCAFICTACIYRSKHHISATIIPSRKQAKWGKMEEGRKITDAFHCSFKISICIGYANNMLNNLNKYDRNERIRNYGAI